MSEIAEWDIAQDDVMFEPAGEILAPTDTTEEPLDISIAQCLEAGARGVMIPNETYHRLPGISGSNLSLLAESNRHLDHKHLFFMQTPALLFGSLVHTLVLEPDAVFDRYAVPPVFLAKAKSGRTLEEQKREFAEANARKIIVDQADFVRAERMARNVAAICGDIIAAGIKERSLFADVDGLLLKCRLDIDLEDEGDDYDLKTITLGIKEFSDTELAKHIKKFKYHWSAAFRNIIRRELGKPVRDSYLIFVNSGSGHMVRKIKIRPLWIREAEAEVNDLLDARRFYLESRIDTETVEIDGNQYQREIEQ